jgi:hypothetical protein
MSVLSLLVVRFWRLRGGRDRMATAGRCRKTSPAYDMDREALAELPGRADVPNGESHTMG